MDPMVEERLKFHRSFRFDRFDARTDWQAVRDWGLPNTAILDGISSANNFDPIRPGRYEAWMIELGQLDPEVRRRLLAMMGVSSAVLQLKDGSGPEYELVPGSARARILEAVFPVDDGTQALNRVVSGELDLAREAVVEGWPDDNPPQGQSGSVELTSQGSNRVSLAVHVPEGGWLFLADIWYPGWQARVDGRPAEIYRMNYLFRGLWLEPGASEVEFLYQPGMFRIGLALTVLGVVALFGLAVVEWRR